MLDCIKNKSFLICLIIFAIGIGISALELIAYGTASKMQTFIIIMNVLNLLIFAGIVLACVYKNKRIIKILTIFLIAWGGIVYLTSFIPRWCANLSYDATAWAASLSNIFVVASLFAVVLGAFLFLLGLLINKNLNKYVVIMYFAAAVICFVAFVFNVISVATTDSAFWGMSVELLLRSVIYLGTGVGVYIFSKKDEPKNLQPKQDKPVEAFEQTANEPQALEPVNTENFALVAEEPSMTEPKNNQSAQAQE